MQQAMQAKADDRTLEAGNAQMLHCATAQGIEAISKN